MALSEDEQRLLEQMEAALAAEDPKLANTLRGTTRRWHRRRAVLAGIGFIAGITCLIAGMQVHPAVSVIGFVIMLAATVVGVSAWQQSGLAGDGQANGGRSSGTSERDFMGRMEDRWRRRQDDGL
jgi:hypothetical protein